MTTPNITIILTTGQPPRHNNGGYNPSYQPPRSQPGQSNQHRSGRHYNTNNQSSSPSVWRSLTNRIMGRPRVLFYHKHDPHYGFTNFSPHPVIYHGKRYPTSEHLFQSFKFQGHRPDLAERIRTCSERPSVAFSEARRFHADVRPDWKQINIQKMDETLWHKFTQHQDLRDELLATADAELIEASDKDAFWGWGEDQNGQNQLGKALERLRDLLRGV